MSVANLKIKVSRQSQDIKAMQKEFQTAQLETGKTAFRSRAAGVQLK